MKSVPNIVIVLLTLVVVALGVAIWRVETKEPEMPRFAAPLPKNELKGELKKFDSKEFKVEFKWGEVFKKLVH